MKHPLRAYLMLRTASGDWSIEVFRDFESVVSTWLDAARRDRVTGVFHIGFDRPPAASFETIALHREGRLLLTGTTKHGVPSGYETASRAIGIVEGLPIYLGTRGWGYTVDEAELEDSSSPVDHLGDVRPDPTGWLKDFLLSKPQYQEALAQHRIHDEPSYQRHEATLEHSVRTQLGAYRFQILSRGRYDDLDAIIRSAPQWLLDRSMTSLNLTVRIANVFKNYKINRVSDLGGMDVGTLLHLPNFGRTSLGKLCQILVSALEDGPRDKEKQVREVDASTLLTEVERSLAPLGSRARDVLQRRMGLRFSRETLQEIGERYDITRERIRQIESGVTRRIMKDAVWKDVLITKLQSLMRGREFPLPVLGVEALDSWFARMHELQPAISYILTNFCGGIVNVVTIDGVDYFSRMTQEEWDLVTADAKKTLASGVGQDWSEDYCRTIVGSHLRDKSEEFRGLLWAHARAHCHFADSADKGRLLVSYGLGIERIVEAVLAESSQPLHYSEICKKAEQRSGRTLDVRQVHNAASAIGILLGRGMYGLSKHLHITPASAAQVIEEVEEIVASGMVDRQWHSSEILSSLIERDAELLSEVDKYSLNHVLKSSAALEYLGRMTWSQLHVSDAAQRQRIDIRQAILSLLTSAGEPLTTEEIRQRLVAVRGLNETFQISESDPLVRIGNGTWGLNDRDVPIKRAQQLTLRNEFVLLLKRRDKGIHISEIARAGCLSSHSDISPHTVMSLVTQDARMKMNTGQYLYLTEWGDSRRESLGDAVQHVVEVEAGASFSLDELQARVEARIERSCSRIALSRCLQESDATFDPSTTRWILPGTQNLPDMEDESDRDLADFHQR